MKIVVNNKYTHLQSWIETVPERFEHEGEIIYNARNQIRILNLPDGTQLNVKRFKQPFFLNRLAYSFFRKSKPVRAYENALHLIRSNVNTPEPIAYIIQKKAGLITRCYLITRQLPIRKMLYELGKDGLAGREELLRAFARFTAYVHEQEIYHRDYSPGNILFDKVEGEWKFALVDINRMNFGAVDITKGCSNFARLWGNTEIMNFIATEYARARGFNENQCRLLVLKAWHTFWQKHDKSLFDYE